MGRWSCRPSKSSLELASPRRWQPRRPNFWILVLGQFLFARHVCTVLVIRQYHLYAWCSSCPGVLAGHQRGATTRLAAATDGPPKWVLSPCGEKAVAAQAIRVGAVTQSSVHVAKCARRGATVAPPYGARARDKSEAPGCSRKRRQQPAEIKTSCVVWRPAADRLGCRHRNLAVPDARSDACKLGSGKTRRAEPS